MRRDRLLFFGILAVLLLGVAVLFFAPWASDWLGPEPVGAWVALEVEGEGLARVGRHEVEHGTRVLLHAVLETRSRGGDPVYYTEAEALEIEGSRIDPDRIRVWDRHLEPRILWFTVEGSGPFRKVESREELEEFHFDELFRPEWERSWSVPAELSSRHSSHLERTEEERDREFGTQRYHVRIDLVDPVEPLVVQKSARSWGADRVFELGDRFPTLVVELPPPLEVVSRHFGLTQIIAGPEVRSEMRERLAELASEELAFTRGFLIREHVKSAGRTWKDLDWEALDWETQEIAWGDRVGAGDLVRVADRVVLLYRDEGTSGTLDGEDLCFDFDRGAVVTRLDQIFTGEGMVEWARVAS